MTEGMLAAVAGVAAVVITIMQWMFAVRSGRRQRDVEMTAWGSAVIETMAAIETACHPISADANYTRRQVELLGERASALLDQGRLFFPNVRAERSKRNDEGTRIKLLDQVLRACYVARYLAAGGSQNGEILRRQVWQARRGFVSLLQKEMSRSLRAVKVSSAGDHIPTNPEDWPMTTRNLNLPSYMKGTEPADERA
ncbi:hypothetical protein [Neorhizobium galegae]|uniref:hypothetical protein n=1 Tax=Neorhizobium galegae TaxID=399 RepID=UPI001273C004|nr:hypothetical protein [Neorhizobium galegae]KAA9385701.1 hypothetical protein F4V88_04105 [Neorhizobium galegae]MCM2499655.1 hypothetical protein [Neorhizobium galegae]